MAGVQSAKAISAVVDGRVKERDYARVFKVDNGSGTTYTVVIDSEGDSCNCTAGAHGTRCYHVIASHLQLARGRTAARDREVTA